MKICAIICEYNPLHAGHIYQIEQTRALTGCDYVIAIMSGSFTQRGVPAVYDKWLRAEAALKNGADIVIELPAAYAVCSAERFALGGVSIANALGIVDFLSFGSECGDAEALTRISEMLSNEPKEYVCELKKQLSGGASFAVCRVRAAEAVMPGAGRIIENSNDILGIEYIKALKKLGSDIVPITVKRVGQSEADAGVSSSFPSALALRAELQKGGEISAFVPENMRKKYACARPVFFEDMFSALRYKILSSGKEEIAACAGVSEGLENAVAYAARHSASFGELVDGIKSKRYARTRICRILANLMLGISKDLLKEIDERGLYARVLGVKKSSSVLLSEISKKSSIPVVMHPKELSHPGLEKDIFAADMRSVFDESPFGRDYTEKFITA